MKVSLITLLCMLQVSVAVGQLKQKMADEHFSLMEYARCVDMYDELAGKCLSGKPKGNWDNVRKAAEAHYHLFEMQEACNYYQSLQKAQKLDENDRMLYVHALRYLGQYDESNALIKESALLHPGNTYFQRMQSETDHFNRLFADSAFYRLHKASVNSGAGEFGAAYYNQSLVYVTKSVNPGFVTPAYGWDNDFYLNLMQSTFGADSVLSEGKLLRKPFLTRAHDGPVSFNADGTEMVITRNNPGRRHGKEIIVLALFFSQYKEGVWSEPVPFEYNHSDYNVGHGVFDESGQHLYFVSEAPGGRGGADLYVSERSGNGWSTPKNLGSAINTERDELFPFVRNDTLYFASNGHFGLGGLDIFEADLKRIAPPHNIGYPVNSSADDFGLIFDRSGILGFLSSNRGDNVDRLYHVKKRPVHVFLEGEVFEKYTALETVPNQQVWIRNLFTQELDSLVTDENGHFRTQLILNQRYRIYTRKQDFILLEDANASTEGIRKDSTLHCRLVLKPTTIHVHLRVIEKESRKVIPLANVSVTDYGLNRDTAMVANEQGMVTMITDRNKVLWAHGSKKGFIDADVSFNTTNENDRVIDLELELPLIKKGEKFKLENIFYDLNKSTLRPESMTALDKLADFIISNNLRIELSAHTDSRGSNSYNQKLSQARAQSCVDYLIKKGVKPANIKAMGYGESQLVNRCKDGVTCTEDEHQENRRTEVKILEVN